MVNQWTTSGYTEQTDYLNPNKWSSPLIHHREFTRWVTESGCKKIVEIGCGNGRVLNALNLKNIKQYVGYDINNHFVKKAKEVWGKHDNVKFICANIEDVTDIEETDVVYIDSVLQMLENPYVTLRKLLNITNCIMISRTRLTPGTYENKGKFKWSGMTEKATNWEFSEENMKEFALNNNAEIIREGLVTKFSVGLESGLWGIMSLIKNNN